MNIEINLISATEPMGKISSAFLRSKTERRYINEQKQKEKYARIEIRVKPKDKVKIKQIADKCGLTVSEYVLQRALGYTPKTVPSDAFFHFYNKLCELLNRELSPEVEVVALKLFDDIYAEIIDASKQTAQQIQREVITGSPQSLLCGEKEQPRSGESFGTCNESDERSVM